MTFTTALRALSCHDLDVYVAAGGRRTDVLLIARPRRHGRVLAVPARRARRPLPADRVRQPGRGRTAMPDGPVTRRGDGRRRRRRAAGARHPVRPRRRLLGGARSPRSWRCGTRSWSAAWCCRARGRRRTGTCAAGCELVWRLARRRRASARSSRRSSSVYTARAHDDGTVDAIIDEALDLSAQQAIEGVPGPGRRLHRPRHGRPPAAIAAPPLVLAGRGLARRPALGRAVAELIPGARSRSWTSECHQPFQEVPDGFNARVDALSRGGRGGGRRRPGGRRLLGGDGGQVGPQPQHGGPGHRP